MAGFCKCMLTEVVLQSNKYGSGLYRTSVIQGARTLFSQSSLGLDGYINARERIQTQFTNLEDKFRTRMSDFVNSTSTNMIFTEDLKNVIHLANTKPEDLDLVLKMMRRFNQQNKEIRFGSFIFGPVVMRMYHFLNKPKAALEAFQDPQLNGFFDQLMSFQLLMNLLYVNEMYQDVLNVFESVQSKLVQGTRYPKNAVVLALATCYKMNTPESYKYAMDLWKSLDEVGHVPTRRAMTFAAALALRNNAPHIAIEMVSSARQQNYISVRNLKIAALADMGRPEDALPLFRYVLESDRPEPVKGMFMRDVVERVKQAVVKLDNKEVTQEFERIEKALKSTDNIEDRTLDNLLCSEISAPFLPKRVGQERDIVAASFSRRYPGGGRPPFRYGQQQQTYRPRVGLTDTE